MKQFKKVLVALDLTEMDQLLIRYVVFLCNLFDKVEEVIFYHNIKFDYPEEAEEILKKLEKPLPKLVEEEIDEKATTHFRDHHPQVKVHIRITSDSSTPQALTDAVNEENAGLIVVGKKNSYQGAGIVTERLLRFGEHDADLIIVPDTVYPSIHNILVPIDFSAESKKSLGRALALAERTEAELSCQHVIRIPARFFPYIPLQDVSATMKKSAEKSYLRFLKSFANNDKLPEIPCAYTSTKGRTIAQTIYHYALAQSKDLIVMSSRGKGKIPGFLVGSVTLRLAKEPIHVPLLIVR